MPGGPGGRQHCSDSDEVANCYTRPVTLLYFTLLYFTCHAPGAAGEGGAKQHHQKML